MFLFQTSAAQKELTPEQKSQMSKLTQEYLGKSYDVRGDKAKLSELTRKYLGDVYDVKNGFWTGQQAQPSQIGKPGESTIANSVVMLEAGFKKYILDNKKDAAAKAVWGLAGAYMNMMSDPLNTSHVGTFQQKLKDYQNQKGTADAAGKKVYEAGERLFVQAFGMGTKEGGMDYQKAQDFSTQLLNVQLRTAQIDNSAPFINFDDVRKVILMRAGSPEQEKAYAALSSNEKNYYDARRTLLDENREKGRDYSNLQIYGFVSAAYMGRGKSTPYSGSDLISAIEGIMDGSTSAGKAYWSARSEFEKEFGSGIMPITSMNIRAQYDFFTKTAPEMKRNGMWTLESINVVNDAVVQLDPFLGFSKFASSVSTSESFSLQSFMANVTAGSLTTLTLSDGTSVSGIFSKSGNLLMIGSMTINTSTSKFTISGGAARDISEISTYTAPLKLPQTPSVQTVGYGNMPDASAMTAFPSAKLDGFFFYAMPELVKHYQPGDINTMVGVIGQSMDVIVSLWSNVGQNTSVVSDVTSTRAALRDFNEKLAKLLVASTAKEAAINEVKAEPYYSSFRTLTLRERTFRQLVTGALQNQLVINPFTDIHLDGLQYYFTPHDGPRVALGSEADVRRLFSDLGLQMVVDPPYMNVVIDKYSNGMRAAVVQAITDATLGFGPKEVPKLYLNSAEARLVTRQTSTKVGDIEQDRTYYYGGAFSMFSGRNTFYNGFVEVTGNKDGFTGSFNASAYNSPFIGNTVLEEGRLSGTVSGTGGVTVLDKIETYMRFLTPAKDNAAIYIAKDNATGTFSVRVAYRTKDNKFRTLTTLENMTDRQVRVLLQHFELNNPYFGPTVTAKFDSNMPGGAKIGDPLSSQNFAGLMFATNFGKNVAIAAFADEAPDSPRLALIGESIRTALINDVGLDMQYVKPRVYQEGYQERQALSSYFNISEKKGLYVEVFNTKRVGDTKASPDEYAVRYIVDQKLSVSGSVDRINAGSSLDSYSFDGKLSVGNVKMQATSAMGVAEAIGTSYYMPSSLTSDPGKYNLVGGTSFAINADKVKEDNTILRRYAYFNLLYNTKGTLWSQVNGDNNINRTIGARYDNLLGWANTTLKVADQESKIPGYERNGYAGLFSDESRKLIRADWDVQASGGNVGPVGVPYNIYGANVRNIRLSDSVSLSAGLIGGKYTLNYAGGTQANALGGAGIRLRVNKPLWQATVLLQNTVEERGGLGGAAGFGIESTDKSKTKFSSYTVGSYRKEDFFKYRHWNIYNINRVNNFGVYSFYDRQSLDLTASNGIVLPASMPTPEAKQMTQFGGALFYQTTDNKWRVYTQLSSLTERLTVTPDRQYTVFSLGATYNRIPGKGKMLYLRNATLQLDYNGSAFGSGATKFSTKNLGAYLSLYFSPW